MQGIVRDAFILYSRIVGSVSNRVAKIHKEQIRTKRASVIQSTANFARLCRILVPVEMYLQGHKHIVLNGIGGDCVDDF